MKIKTAIANKLLGIQRNIADYLNGKVKLLSRQQLKVCLVVFVVLFVAASVLAIIDSFQHSMTKPVAIKTIITEPTDPTLKRIHHFRLYMDSLKVHNAIKYDSIIRLRPKLMDSILTIERINHY